MESCLETTSSFEKTYHIGNYGDIFDVVNDFNDIVGSFSIDSVYVKFHAKEKSNVFPPYQVDLDNTNEAISVIQTMCECSSEDVVVTLALEANKIKSNSLQIIDVESFLSSLELNPIIDQINFWNESLRERFKTIKIADVEFENIFDDKKDNLNGLISRTSRDLDASGVSVGYLSFLMGNLPSSTLFYNYLSKIRNVICLILISNNDADFDGFIRFGHNNFDLDSLTLKYHLENNERILRLYDWCFNDERHGTKLGIINHILSQSKGDLICFDDNLFQIIKSHYQFHLRNEFEGYLDVRNKLAESTLDICTKVSEYIGSIDKTVLQILFVILSYFFSIVVFTGIDKGKFENLFSIELASLTSVFIFGAIFVIWVSKNEYDKKIKVSRMQLKEIKTRNKYFLTEEEIDDFFESESLKTVLKSSEDRVIVLISYLILAMLLMLVWYFYSVRESFVSIPVLLHIV
ncbi:hypothetical protein AB4359_23800 [Vibrio splendidus]